MNVRIESSWQQRLQSEFDKPYFENLTAFVRTNMLLKRFILPVVRFLRLSTPVRSTK